MLILFIVLCLFCLSCSAYSAYCLLLVLLIVRGHSPVISFLIVSLSSACRSRLLLHAFVVFFVVFSFFLRFVLSFFFFLLRLSSFFLFVSSSSSDLVLRSSLEDGGLRHSTVFCRLHVDSRLPVVFFLLRRRLLFLQSLSSSISEIFQLLWKWPAQGPSHRSRRVATAGSVRDRFRIQQLY